jgi:hypothetical protein
MALFNEERAPSCPFGLCGLAAMVERKGSCEAGRRLYSRHRAPRVVGPISFPGRPGPKALSLLLEVGMQPPAKIIY